MGLNKIIHKFIIINIAVVMLLFSSMAANAQSYIFYEIDDLLFGSDETGPFAPDVPDTGVSLSISSSTVTMDTLDNNKDIILSITTGSDIDIEDVELEPFYSGSIIDSVTFIPHSTNSKMITLARGLSNPTGSASITVTATVDGVIEDSLVVFVTVEDAVVSDPPSLNIAPIATEVTLAYDATSVDLLIDLVAINGYDVDDATLEAEWNDSIITGVSFVPQTGGSRLMTVTRDLEGLPGTVSLTIVAEEDNGVVVDTALIVVVIEPDPEDTVIIDPVETDLAMFITDETADVDINLSTFNGFNVNSINLVATGYEGSIISDVKFPPQSGTDRLMVLFRDLDGSEGVQTITVSAIKGGKVQAIIYMTVTVMETAPL